MQCNHCNSHELAIRTGRLTKMSADDGVHLILLASNPLSLLKLFQKGHKSMHKWERQVLEGAIRPQDTVATFTGARQAGAPKDGDDWVKTVINR